ncbi:MAG: PKD domain-containing protein [Myxococcales bacterium]|nr:PKD domain-containing protein [Myxococcales bacterium]
MMDRGWVCFLALVLLLSTSCGGGGGSSASDDPPRAALSHPLIVKRGEPVSFDASRSRDAEPDGQLTYTFIFGDGTPALVTSTQTASHTFDLVGTFQVSLTVEDRAGHRTQVVGELNVVDNIDPFRCPENACTNGTCIDTLCVVDLCTTSDDCESGSSCVDQLCEANLQTDPIP